MIRLVSKEPSQFTTLLASFPFSYRFEFASGGAAEEKPEFSPHRWKLDIWNAPVRFSAVLGDLGLFIYQKADGDFLIEPGYTYRFELGESPPEPPPTPPEEPEEPDNDEEPTPEEPDEPDTPNVPEGWFPNSIHIFFGGIPDEGTPVVSYYTDAKFATFGVHRSQYMRLWEQLEQLLLEVATPV